MINNKPILNNYNVKLTIRKILKIEKLLVYKEILKYIFYCKLLIKRNTNAWNAAKKTDAKSSRTILRPDFRLSGTLHAT